jgi:glycosyltransferase involved in cell wall biosynthesis
MKNQEGRPLVFISWAEDCSRSDSLAKKLDGVSVMVYSPFWGSRYSTILIKYLSQSLKTLRVLFRYRPRAVFVMTPPVVACAAVWLYTKIARARYAIDAHSAALLYQRWRWSLFIHAFFSRHAVVTLVTNEFLADMLRKRGAKTHIVRDVPIHFAEPRLMKLKGRSNVTFISTFTRDEPLEALLGAAAQIPDVHFYITGRLKDADPETVKRASPNVTFTDFLSDSEYSGLLLASDAVICLTTEDHTMQRGAYEAVYLRKPVITSDFPILRESFPIGTVHVHGTAVDIANGVREMMANLPRYQNEVQQLQLQKLRQWKDVEQEIRHLFRTAHQPAGTGPAVGALYERPLFLESTKYGRSQSAPTDEGARYE